MVRFIDLYEQHKEIEGEIVDNFKQIIKENAFVYGKYLESFEQEFAKKLKVKHCIGVANGTDALTITLKCLGITNNDEVITAANSFIATAEAISHTGAKPVFVDHDEYFGIDSAKIEEKITPKTKAIIPVHLYGQACNIEEIKRICKKHNLLLIEDTAQAHFTSFKGKYAGTFGDAACFSFYPSKNLGALGDGGAIVTNDDSLAKKIRIYTNHGSPEKYVHVIEGVNSRLDAIQAAFLKIKLDHIEKWNSMRYEAGLLYNKYLANCNHIEVPKIREFSSHIFHLYVIKCKQRKELQEHLQKNAIQSGIHYPTALPFLDCYSSLAYSENDFPISFKTQSEILSLPMFPHITKEEIKYVCDKIIDFYRNNQF